MLPTVTLPNERLVGLDPKAPNATPVPDKTLVSVEFDASEVIVIVPLALPLVCGAKATVRVVLCEALSVSGVVIPLSSNPVPLTEACEMFTLDPPLLVRVTVCDCLAPMVTLPKSSLAGLSMSCPEDVPVPVSVRFVAGFEASLVMARVALKAPATLGANLMLTVVLCPAATVIGRVGATSVKYFVEIAALLMVTGAGPEFVAVTVSVLLLLIATVPKFRLEGSERVLDCCCPEGPATLTPWQPTSKRRPATRSKAPATLPKRFEFIAMGAFSSICSHGTLRTRL